MILYEAKLVAKCATVYMNISSKERPLQLFQMLAEVVTVCCNHKKSIWGGRVGGSAAYGSTNYTNV